MISMYFSSDNIFKRLYNEPYVPKQLHQAGFIKQAAELAKLQLNTSDRVQIILADHVPVLIRRYGLWMASQRSWFFVFAYKISVSQRLQSEHTNCYFHSRKDLGVRASIPVSLSSRSLRSVHIRSPPGDFLLAVDVFSGFLANPRKTLPLCRAGRSSLAGHVQAHSWRSQD